MICLIFDMALGFLNYIWVFIFGISFVFAVFKFGFFAQSFAACLVFFWFFLCAFKTSNARSRNMHLFLFDLLSFHVY
jgi:hypothetical protein